MQLRRSQSDAAIWAVLTAAVILATQLVLFVTASRSMPQEAIDYRAFYAAGLTVRRGDARLLYEDTYQARTQLAASGPLAASLPFLYPPFAALFFVPLTVVSYGKSIALFRIVNLLLAGASACLLARTARLPQGGSWLLWALVLGFNPVCFTLLQNQISMLLLLLFCAADSALDQDRPVIAGLLLAVTLIKFQLTLPIMLLFLLWRRWRVLQGFLAGAALLVSVSGLLVGLPGLIAYCRSVTGMEHRVAAGVPNYSFFLTKMPNLYGLANLGFGNRPVSVIVTVAASLALLAWAGTRRPSLSVAVVVAILVSYHLLPYDLTLLLLPLAVTARNWLRPEQDLLSSPQLFRRRASLAAGGLLLLPPIYLALESRQVMPLMVMPMLLLLPFLAEPREQARSHVEHARPAVATA